MTHNNSLKPLILVLNPSTESNYLFNADTYYYFTVEMQRPYDNYRVFTGKCWAKRYGYSPYGEVMLDISSIVKPFMYNGQRLIEPVYNNNTMDFTQQWDSNGSIKTTIDSGSALAYGFGVCNVYVHFYASPADLNSVINAVLYKEVQVTSSWSIEGDIMYQNDVFDLQEISQYEFGETFISHYPKVLTNNFGVFGLINMSSDYYNNSVLYSLGKVIQVGNDSSTAPSLNGIGDTLNAGGYFPFKIKLAEVIQTLTPWIEGRVILESIQSGDSEMIADNEFLTGDSVPYTPDNTWICGNSNPQQSETPGIVKSNDIYIIPQKHDGGISLEPARGEGWIKIATLDECYSRYYLVWMTKSCVPVCYGFDGNNIKKYNFSYTEMTNEYDMNVTKIEDIKSTYELRSGIINKATYRAMQDIFTSPWCLLYDTMTDTTVYVKASDNAFTVKNNVFEDKRPFTFTINITEIQSQELLH